MKKVIVILFMTVSLIVGHVGVGKIAVLDDYYVVLAEEGSEAEKDGATKSEKEPTPKSESEEESESNPDSESEIESDPKPNPEPKPETDPEPAPEVEPDPEPEPEPNPEPKENDDPPVAPTPTESEKKDVKPRAKDSSKGNKSVDRNVISKTKNDDDGFLTLAQLKETEVMITQEDGDFYVIYKDDDDNIAKQKITEFAAIQLGFEKEVVEKEEERVDNVELVAPDNDGLSKKMFGVISASVILLGLIIGTYVYYRKEMT